MIRRSSKINISRMFFVVGVAVLGVLPVVADAATDGHVAQLRTNLTAQTTEYNDLIAKKNAAQAELEKRQQSGASVEQISQVQLSLQALSKLSDAAESKMKDIQNQLHVLDAQARG